MSVDTAAALVGVVKDLVYQRTDAKRLLTYRVGKLWTFNLRVVND